MGEDLGPLSSKELESLERQLDSSLKQIRSIRVLKFPTLPISILTYIIIFFQLCNKEQKKLVDLSHNFIYNLNGQWSISTFLIAFYICRPNSCWISFLIYNVRYEVNYPFSLINLSMFNCYSSSSAYFPCSPVQLCMSLVKEHFLGESNRDLIQRVRNISTYLKLSSHSNSGSYIVLPIGL